MKETSSNDFRESLSVNAMRLCDRSIALSKKDVVCRLTIHRILGTARSSISRKNCYSNKAHRDVNSSDRSRRRCDEFVKGPSDNVSAVERKLA